MKPNGQYHLLPPSPDEIREIVTVPAIAAGLTFGKVADSNMRLDSLLCDEACRNPGALPLLEFVLDELYRHRSPDDELTYAAYSSIGGLAGAVGKYAAGEFDGLPSRVRDAFEEIAKELVRVDPDAPDTFTRRSPSLATVARTPAARDLVQALIRARVLTVDGTVVALTHETLLTHWVRLRDFLEGHRQLIRIRDRVADDSAVWESNDRRRDLLLSPGLPVLEAKPLLSVNPPLLSDIQQEFVRRSVRKMMIRRWMTLSATIAIAAFGIFAIIAQQREANARRAMARALAESYFREAVIRLEGDRPFGALAYAARAIAINPAHEAARTLTLDMLLWRPWPRLSVQMENASAVSLSANGKFLLASAKNSAYVYDVASGAIRGGPLVHVGPISAVAITGDATAAVTAESSGKIRLWSLGSNNVQLRAWQDTGPVYSIEFTRTGRRFAVQSHGSVQVWDTSTGERVGPPLRAPDGTSVSFGRGDSRLVLVGGRDSAWVWDYERGAPVGKPLHIEGGGIASFICTALDDSGRFLLIASYGAPSSARVWDSSTGEPVSPVLVLKDLPVRGWFLSNGDRLAIISRDGAARVWNFRGEADAAPTEFADENTVSAAAVSPEGLWVATVATSGAVHVWDRRAGKRAPLALSPVGSATAGALSENGKFAASLSSSGISIMETESGNVSRFKVESDGARLAVRNDGQQVVLTSPSKQTGLWDTGSHQFVAAQSTPQDERAFEGNMPTLGLFYNPGGTRYVDIHGRVLTVMSAQKKQIVGKPLKHDDIIRTAAFSPDGAMLVTSSRDGTVRIWNSDSGEQIAVFRHDEAVVGASLVAGENRVISVMRDGVLSSWDAATKQRLSSVPLRNSGLIGASSISRNGSRAATTDYRQTVKLWDPNSGLPIGSQLLNPDFVLHVPLSDDGTRLLTVGTAVRLWDLPAAGADEASVIARWAEAVAGLHVIDSVGLRRLENAQQDLAALRNEAKTHSGERQSVWRMVQWWFSDPWSRTVSPQSSLLVENYIDRLIREGSPESLKEVRWTFPEHPSVRGR